MTDYPNPAVLVDVGWLNQHLADPHLRILDVRASDPRLPIGYRMGHIPGAISLDPTRDFFATDRGAPILAEPELVASMLGERGISNENMVVIYDEWTGQLAALCYWALSYVGHPELRLLHGGWALWRQGNNPVTSDVPNITPVEYRPRPNPAVLANAQWIQANLGRQEMVLLDVRTPEEYRMGHIPGAVNLSYDTAFEPGAQTFKSPAQLRASLASIGATPDKEIIAYCAAGARSAHTFATLQLLGYPRVRNYYGSMADWHRVRGLPIEQGE